MPDLVCAAVNRPGPPVDLPTDRYQFRGQLGHGGMGRVYRVQEKLTGRPFALKTLEMNSAGALALFEREYRTLASIEHPAIVRAHDYGWSASGQRYYVMALIEGRDLYACSPMPFRDVCQHLRTVASALSILHARKLVHRDVSPKNIRIDENDRATLLDFGALAEFGPTEKVVGTPACIPPEALDSMPLDGRSDLFSLGATAYIALTKKRPYAVRDLTSAKAAYQVPPAPPSEQAEDVPKALDDLVLDLLSVDPRKRPASAAHVIERLTAIADLPELEDAHLGHSVVHSSALIGRDREMKQLRGHVTAAFNGRGGTLAIQGAARMGATRLAEEIVIESQLLGATTVAIDGAAHDAVDGQQALRSLQLTVLRAAPRQALQAAGESPKMRDMIHALLDSGVDAGKAPVDSGVFDAAIAPGEQQALTCQWIRDVAARRPLMLCVDNAHALDSLTAGVLYGLAHETGPCPLALLMILTDGLPAPHAVQQATRLASRIKLRGLPATATEQLIGALFGEVQHRARLATWAQEVAGGNPGHCIDLMKELTRRGVIRCMSGSWSLPNTFPTTRLPLSVEDAQLCHVRSLSAPAARFARLLALHGGPVPTGLCLRLAGPEGLDTVALPLLHDQIIKAQQDTYGISHADVNRALLSDLTPTQKTEFHRQLGEALIAEAGPIADERTGVLKDGWTAQVGTLLRAGHHLSRGGDPRRGRRLLGNAGIMLARKGEGLLDCVAAIREALEGQTRDGRCRFERSSLQAPLLLAGAYVDYKLTYEYSDEAITTLLDASGFSLAGRLARHMPHQLALWTGLGTAAVLRPVTGRRHASRSFKESILACIGLASATLGTYSALTDGRRALRVLNQLQPLSWFPKGHAVQLAYEFQHALADVACGHYTPAVKRSRRVLAALDRPEGVRGMPEEARRQFVTGVYIVIGSIDCYRVDRRVDQTLSALASTNTSLARETRAGILANFHASRGEYRRFEQARELLDVLAAQGGSPWRQDVLIPRCIWWTETQCEDTLGLRRSVRQLETIVADSPCLTPTYAAAHACYLAERGMAEQALQTYGAELERAVASITPLAMRIVGAYSRVLRKAGRPDQSLQLCRRAMQALSCEDRELLCLVHGASLEMGLAMLELGRLEEARTHFDQLCAEQEAHDNPLLRTLTHHARARLALVDRDAETFRRHTEWADRWAQRADNPALFALVQRLRSGARARGLTAPLTDGPDARQSRIVDRNRALVRKLAECRGAAQRHQTALDILVDASGAAHGFLYLWEPGGLRLAAPMHGAEPPAELSDEMDARAASWTNSDTNGDSLDTQLGGHSVLSTVVNEQKDWHSTLRVEARAGHHFHATPLLVEQDGSLRVIGAAALMPGATPVRTIAPEIIDAITQAVYDAGDATAVG